ncbi:hypothetical protein [Paenibacillus sp. SI8]|uniref:hypothetical protein n=1 Tax=unclassified Paenibacillus TaxID=185978 RepID=UPI003465C0A3
MSIFRLASNVNYPIDSRYIQSCDMDIRNLGSDAFDILIQFNNETGITHSSLHHITSLAAPGSTLTVPSINTQYAPFSILIVTSLLTTHTTALTLFAKSNEKMIAIFTQNDFIKFE